MANVQIAVWLRRKTGVDPPRMLARRPVGLNDLADEIQRLGNFRIRGRFRGMVRCHARFPGDDEKSGQSAPAKVCGAKEPAIMLRAPTEVASSGGTSIEPNDFKERKGLAKRGNAPVNAADAGATKECCPHSNGDDVAGE